ncbi:MAG: hypothetical protein JSU88_06970 [Nitrospinaceae bacterium]|nr:MAG: hypothetical protein JSU88_06970 [Nitrospinaceae bacterium]
MIQRITHLLKLIQVLRERGNWPLIRHSRRQLIDFILCREGMGKRSLPAALLHGCRLLDGLEVIVWRLETFGFLFPPEISEEQKQRLNRYL